jgi:NAD(P)-dependent dehydrogenase (short-subunit alcohol dehydrogenase family)
MQKAAPKRRIRPSQAIRSTQGKEGQMNPEPVYEKEKTYQRLAGKVAIITGGDSGIGRAVAIAFVKEGAEVCIAYRNDHRDAKETANRIEELGGKCLLLPGDISAENHCKKIVRTVLATWKRIDIIVNNAAVQFPQKKLGKITSSQLRRTFEVNVFSQLYLTKAAEKYLRKGAAIINTTSVTAYRGSSHLIDYAATKGAIVSMIRSLAAYFSEKGIRVNGVAPGPVWTPLIPTTFSPKEVATFGSDTPLKRAANPVEIAYAYVFLASDDASYITGQVLHPNGGEIVNA